jgi:hypothetical protein
MAVHSDLEVGVDKAKMMGRSLIFAIRFKACTLKALGIPDAPINAVGCNEFIAEGRSSIGS